MANGIATINGKFTSIRDVASTSQTAQQQPFGAGAKASRKNDFLVT